MLTLTFMVPVLGSLTLFLFSTFTKKNRLSSVMTQNTQFIIGGFNHVYQVSKLTGCGLEKAGFGSTKVCKFRCIFERIYKV